MSGYHTKYLENEIEKYYQKDKGIRFGFQVLFISTYNMINREALKTSLDSIVELGSNNLTIDNVRQYYVLSQIIH